MPWEPGPLQRLVERLQDVCFTQRRPSRIREDVIVGLPSAACQQLCFSHPDTLLTQGAKGKRRDRNDTPALPRLGLSRNGGHLAL